MSLESIEFNPAVAEGLNGSSSGSAVESSAAVRMKKVRKRGQFKSSTTPLEDEKEEEGEAV